MSTIVWKWLADNSDALQAGGAILSAVAILVAVVQLRESSASRDVTDSLNLVERLETYFVNWQRNRARDSSAGNLALTSLLATYEVCASGLNRQRFSLISTDLLRHHVRDGLAIIFQWPSAAEAVRIMAQHEAVFSALRRLLLRNYKFISKNEGYKRIYSGFFSDEELVADTLSGWRKRLWEDVRISFPRSASARGARLTAATTNDQKTESEVTQPSAGGAPTTKVVDEP